MDALMLSLILCAVSESGGANSRRYDLRIGSAPGTIFLALAIASIVNAAIAAAVGAWIAPMLTPEARALFLGAALAMAGGTLLFASRRNDRQGVQPARHASAFYDAARMVLTGMAGSAPFLISAISIYFSDPVMSGIGGGVGCIIGSIAGHWAGADRTAYVLRAVMGLVGVMVAFVLAIGALRLV